MTAPAPTFNHSRGKRLVAAIIIGSGKFARIDTSRRGQGLVY
jgi:hypothetical protein